MNLRILAEEVSRGHYWNDDSWYSCPLAAEGCANEEVPPGICNCGLEETIERNRKILEKVYQAGASNEPLEG
jgi:hypothetical protein